MAKQNLTMSELRATLCQAIDDVSSGKIDAQRASAIAKLAAQVNQSLLSEVEIARLHMLRKVDGHEIGSLPIGAEREAIAPPQTIEATPIAKSSAPLRPIVRRDVASTILGDPTPGRSALDQRKGAP